MLRAIHTALLRRLSWARGEGPRPSGDLWHLADNRLHVRYDVVTISEAADEMAATALALTLGGMGNIRTETLRAFSAEDMKTIISKMA